MVKVINHRPGLIRLLRGKVELKPGENEVADDAWQEAKTNPHTLNLIAHKLLQVVVEGKTATPLPAKPSAPPEEAPSEEEAVQVEEAILTRDMSAKDAINMVKASSDVGWLKVCGEGETRTTVIDAIEGQLETLGAD